MKYWKYFALQFIFAALLGFTASEAAYSLGRRIGFDFSQSTALAFGFAILMTWLYLVNNSSIRKMTINEIFGDITIDEIRGDNIDEK